MKKIVVSSVLALLLILVFSLPSMAQETANVTVTATAAANATTTAATTNATTTAATTNATTTAAGVTSFLSVNGSAAPPVPGFEAIFAVAGILCIAVILKKKIG